MGNNSTKTQAPPGPPKGELFTSRKPQFVMEKPRFPLPVPYKQQQSYHPYTPASTAIAEKQYVIPNIPPTSKHINAHELWETLYMKDKENRQDLDQFNSRIEQHALERALENKRLRIQRQREAEESRLFSEKVTNTRPLTLNSTLSLAPRFNLFRIIDEKFFAPKKDRPDLTPEILMQIEDASRPQPANEALVEIDGVQLLRKDIKTLTGLNWLNDEIINAYMYLLVVRGQESNHKKVYAFNTFFYPKLRETGYNSVRRWTRKVDIFSYDFLLVPVHLGNHWCLAFVDFTTKEISYYDSLGGRSNGCCDTLLDYLRFELKDKKKEEFDDQNWDMKDKYHEDGIPQQQNCSDCGVFACTYAEYLTRQAALKFKQEHMPYFRKKMIYELITKRILS